MPSDLDQLAQDNDHQDRWQTPRWSNDLQDLAGQQQMTHQPDQPNPAAPYLQGARDIASRTFVEPLRGAGFLPQQQTPTWYDQARQAGEQFFRQGPAPMMAGMFPRGGLAQIAAQSGYVPPWVNDNVLTHALRHPSFTQATQFFTPLVGALTLFRAANARPVFGKDQFEILNKETGEKRGDVWLTFNPVTKNLEVGYMQATPKPGQGGVVARDQRRWALGRNPIEAALELRSALPEAFRFYPDMRTVEFYGIGGAKGFHNVGANLKFEVERTPEGVSWKRIKHELQGEPSRPTPFPTPPPPIQPISPSAGPSQRPITPPPPLPPPPGGRTGTLEEIIRRRMQENQ